MRRTVAVFLTALLGACGETVAPTPDFAPGGPAPKITSLEVTPPDAEVEYGLTLQLTVVARDRKAQIVSDPAVTWTSGDPAVVSVSSTGLVTAVGAGGPITITASTGGKHPVVGTATITVVGNAGWLAMRDTVLRIAAVQDSLFAANGAYGDYWVLLPLVFPGITPYYWIELTADGYWTYGTNPTWPGECTLLVGSTPWPYGPTPPALREPQCGFYTIDAMTGDLRRLVSVEDSLFAANGAYGSSPPGFTATPGVVGPTIILTADGWGASVTHTASAWFCTVFVGSTPFPPAQQVREPACGV
jgi:hypothetical protein